MMMPANPSPEAGSFRLTVGPVPDGRHIAIITTGGGIGTGNCEVLTVEVVDGWSRRKLTAWFKKMVAERPWETRQ